MLTAVVWMAAAALMALPARCDISWGSKSATSYMMTYDTKVYGSGPSGSNAFCQKWRLACIGYVGPLNYHHVVSCGASEQGPTIFNVCAAVQKNEDGTWTGDKTPCDFTNQVIGRVSGVTIAAQPSNPYAACAAGGAPPAGATTDVSDDSPEQASSSTSSPETATSAQATPTTTSTSTTSTTSSPSSSLASSSSTLAVATTIVTSSVAAVTFSAAAVSAAPSVSDALNPFAANNQNADASSNARTLFASLLLVGAAGSGAVLLAGH